MRNLVLAWLLFSLNPDESLGPVVAIHATEQACISHSFRLAFLTGQESHCLGDYALRMQ